MSMIPENGVYHGDRYGNMNGYGIYTLYCNHYNIHPPSINFLARTSPKQRKWWLGRVLFVDKLERVYYGKRYS